PRMASAPDDSGARGGAATPRLATCARLPALAVLAALLLGLAGCVPGAPAARWSSRARMSVPRDEFGAAVAAGRIYAFGGMTGQRGHDLSLVEAYDPATNTWQTLPPLPRPRSGLRAGAVGTRVYLVGGSSGAQPTARVESFDVRTERYREEPPLPRARFGHAVVAIGPRVYALGGLQEATPTGAVDVLDTTTATWSAAAPLPTPRFNLAAVVVGGRIYAIGGRTRDEPLATVEVYDPTRNRWRAGPSLPRGLSNFDGGVVGDTIHVVFEHVHWALPEGGDAWRAEAAPRVARHGLAVLEVGFELFAIGGCTEAE